jgi:chorismate-pyruvate lyase
MLKHLEPEWRSIADLPSDLSATLYGCITTTGSLTTRLRELGVLRVELIKEYVENTHWHRDVVLWSNNLPAVIGHSVILTDALADPALNSLKNLGTRPLGEVIFSELKGTRELLEFACITPQDNLFHLAKPYLHHEQKKLYARRSTVKVQQHKIKVHEVFLPAFYQDIL